MRIPGGRKRVGTAIPGYEIVEWHDSMGLISKDLFYISEVYIDKCIFLHQEIKVRIIRDWASLQKSKIMILFSRGLSKHAHTGLNFHNTYFARFLAYKIIWVRVPSAYHCHGRSFGILYPYLDGAVWETSPWPEA